MDRETIAMVLGCEPNNLDEGLRQPRTKTKKGKEPTKPMKPKKNAQLLKQPKPKKPQNRISPLTLTRV